MVSSLDYVNWFGLLPSVVARNIEGSLASSLEFMWGEWVVPSIV